MSLTAHLGDKTSPVRQYFEETFPGRKALFSQIRTALTASTTIQPTHKQESLVGTAFDYRLRYFLNVVPSRESVAYEGARLASNCPFLRRDERISGRLVEKLFDYIDSIVAEINPAGRIIDPSAELHLNRCCVVLAFFERIWRNPEVIATSPLLNPSPITDINQAFRTISRNILYDIGMLSERFYTTQQELISKQDTAVLNPVFSGSCDIDGADADLIVNGVLIDIKSITKPGGRLNAVYQLAGYCLLDYADEYGIRGVGLYFARQGVLVAWPLDEFFSLLSAGEFEIGPARLQFRSLLLSESH